VVEAPGELDRVHDALRRVVALGRSIADGDAVRDVLRAAGPGAADELGETLAAALSNPRLTIRMEPTSLRQLTWDHRADGLQTFQFLREGLFTELGLTLPPIHLHPDPALAPGGFAVDLDDLPGLPHIGLAPGTVLVNDSPERLELLHVEGTSCLVPATSQRGSIVSQDHAAILEAAGLTAWDQLGFLVLSLAGEVRRIGYRWIDRPTADLLLGRFALMFPQAERAARAGVPLDRLTVVLRDLLRDNLSIRNLRRILGVLTDAGLDGALPADGRQAVDVVRTALRDEIGFRAKRGTATVTAYLLDPELEAEVAADVDDRRGRRLADALRRELATLPPGAQPPVILTRRLFRTQVRAAVEPDFPRVRILSYDDLPPQANVQPVARISAD
jgi:type III secretion protein V